MNLDLMQEVEHPQRPTWESIFALARVDPIVRTAVTLVERGDITIVAALVRLAFAQYEARRKLVKALVDIKNATVSPIVMECDGKR